MTGAPGTRAEGWPLRSQSSWRIYLNAFKYGGTGAAVRVRGGPRRKQLPPPCELLGAGSPWLHADTADCIVVGLDTDCRWAAVTDSRRHGGFVLFRPPALDPTDITAARATLSATGIDPCTVRYTPQGGANAITAPVPVCDRCWRGGHARNA